MSQRRAGTLPAAVTQARELLEMVKFQHSLFALPFALTGLIAAAQGVPDLRTLGLVVACMVTARTAAMTWNRIADRELDAENPRTRLRALPAGRVTLAGAWLLLLVSVALFVAGAAALNALTLALSPVALAVILGYSWTKRFTWATHFVLGLALGIAPMGAWIAVRGRFDAEPLALVLAVVAWVAGFDLLYACQDADHDRHSGLFSIPARFGIPTALTVARACHVIAAVGLFGFGLFGGHGLAYFVGAGLATAVMAWSHGLVSPDDLTRVGLAFFQANVAVSLLVLAGTLVDVLT